MAAMLLFGCHDNNAKKESNTNLQSTTQDTSGISNTTTFRVDSFSFSTSSRHGTCDINMDFPVGGPENVVSAVREFIKSTLFENGGITYGDDPETLMHEYCKERMEMQGKMLEQMGIKQVNKDNAPEEGIDIKVVCITPKFVTYEIYRYSYITHGAHGEYSDYGVTFRIKDGHRFGDDIISQVDERLYSHIREGMKRYFGVKRDEELEEICTADLSLLPMPTFPPYLVRDGVRFHYSIYDLCPFEYGDPMITIPYEIVMPYLTEAAREMVE